MEVNLGEPAMQKFIGTKLLYAKPMNRLGYCHYRGWQVPADENPNDEGYLVEYQADGKPNHPDHHGYISWSPKDVFEAAYNAMDSMTFGHALVALEAGERVARAGWNGKGMWLMLIQAEEKSPTEAFWSIDFADYDIAYSGIRLLPWIGMKTADNGFVPWLTSQTDMLAKDWGVVNG
jgi:hypothetical protein